MTQPLDQVRHSASDPRPRVLPLGFLRPTVLPLALLVILGTYVAMARWTWGIHAHPFIDSGREVYVPWRLSVGEVLYRDIAYFNGPLSPYFNSLAMRLLGVHINSVLYFNLGVIAAVTALIFLIVRSIGTLFTATVCAVTYLVVHAFGMIFPLFGGFSFALPYSHEMSHGTLLVLLQALCWIRFAKTSRFAWLAGAGISWGLALLTKVEMGLAASALGGLLTVVTLWRCVPAARRARTLVLVIVSLMAPIVLVVGLLALRLPFTQMTESLLAPYRHATDPVIRNFAFYRWVSGFDAPRTRIIEILLVSGFYVGALGAATGIAFAVRRLDRRVQAGVTLVVVVVLFWGLWRYSESIRWIDAVVHVPYVAAATVLFGLVRVARSGASPDGDRAPIAGMVGVLALATAGFAMSLKMILKLTPVHYGFALSVPGSMLLIWIMLDALPRWVARRGGIGLLVTGVSTLLIGFCVTTYLFQMRESVAMTPARYGTDRGVIWAESEAARQMATMLSITERAMPPGATLAVLPEGVMLNFLLDRRNPTPYIVAIPVEMRMFGEDAITEAYRRNPPDFIISLHRETPYFGAPLFGRHYGLKLKRWIDENYEKVAQVGEEPHQAKDKFGMQLLRRRSPFPIYPGRSAAQ